MNINILCLAITNTADKRCPELLDKAQITANKYKTVLTLFERCHRVYTGQQYITDDDLHDLGKEPGHLGIAKLLTFKTLQK